jgi:predicted AlkP superfamily phosphohydrolase/phosphomutase
MSNRVLVIGLDGATFDLIEPLVAAGELPTFARLLREGAHGRLRTVPNTDTAPAWTTFATGLGPANHGLFHEIDWSPDRRTLRPVRGGERTGAPFWKLASAAGRRVAIVNVPFSYPVEPVNGIMIAGIDAPGPQAPGFCHPPDLLERLVARLGPYHIDSQISMAIKADRPAQGLAAAYAVVELHTAALLATIEQQPWDLATLVYSIPDEMQHFFWQQMLRKSGPQHSAIADAYRFIDRQIARLQAVAGPAATTVILSDHGFGPICATPALLAERLRATGFLHELPGAHQPLARRLSQPVYGLLRRYLGEGAKEWLRRRLPAVRNRVETSARLGQVDWASTRAYVGSSPWEVYINLQGREPNGSVAPGAAYEQACTELSASLLAWCREAVYHGRYLAQAPDLTLEWDPAAAPSPTSLPGNQSRFDADHQPEGILIIAGPTIRGGHQIENAGLADVAPTILQLLGVPLPAECDGRIVV